MTLAGIIGVTELLVILVALLFFFLLPILALIDIIRSRFEGNLQIAWVLIVLFFNIIGSILYFFIGKEQKLK